MKRLAVIVGCLCLMTITGSIVYYFLILSPKISQERLEFDKAKQASIERQNAAEQKQKCLDRRAKAIEVASRDPYIPNLAVQKAKTENSCE